MSGGSSRGSSHSGGVARLVAAGALIVAATTGCAANGTDASVPAPTTTTDSGLSAKFALITDFGNCDEGSRAVADMVAKWDVGLVATAGDNTQRIKDCVPYTESVEDYYGDFVHGADGPQFYPVPGNHDYENKGAGEAAYLDYFSYLKALSDTGLWYKVSLGDVNLFMIDSELDGDRLETQKQWLKGALGDARREKPASWNIVVFHRPPFTSGPHGANTEMRPAAGWDYKGWGADAVVSGHQHVLEQLSVDGLPYIVAGVGASDLQRKCPSPLVAESKGCWSGDGALLVTATSKALTFDYRHPAGDDGTTLKTIRITR